MQVVFIDIGISVLVKQLESVLDGQMRGSKPVLEPVHCLVDPVEVLRLSDISVSVHDGQEGLVINHLSLCFIHKDKQVLLLIVGK
jgi:hypothetical protein